MCIRFIVQLEAQVAQMQIPTSTRLSCECTIIAAAIIATVLRVVRRHHTHAYVVCNHIVGLVQPVLVLQLLIPAEKAFGFEVVVVDQQSRKRRLIFSNNFREVEATELNAKVEKDCNGDRKSVV